MIILKIWLFTIRKIKHTYYECIQYPCSTIWLTHLIVWNISLATYAWTNIFQHQLNHNTMLMITLLLILLLMHAELYCCVLLGSKLLLLLCHKISTTYVACIWYCCALFCCEFHMKSCGTSFTLGQLYHHVGASAIIMQNIGDTSHTITHHIFIRFILKFYLDYLLLWNK